MIPNNHTIEAKLTAEEWFNEYGDVVTYIHGEELHLFEILRGEPPMDAQWNSVANMAAASTLLYAALRNLNSQLDNLPLEPGGKLAELRHAAHVALVKAETGRIPT